MTNFEAQFYGKGKPWPIDSTMISYVRTPADRIGTLLHKASNTQRNMTDDYFACCQVQDAPERVYVSRGLFAVIMLMPGYHESNNRLYFFTKDQLEADYKHDLQSETNSVYVQIDPDRDDQDYFFE